MSMEPPERPAPEPGTVIRRPNGTFAPGSNVNPGGFAKMRPISSEYTRQLEEEAPPVVFRRMKLPYKKGVKLKQLVAFGQILAAAKGATYAAQEIADRVEGKVPQALTDADGGKLRLSPAEVAAEILELARLAKLRRGVAEEATGPPPPIDTDGRPIE